MKKIIAWLLVMTMTVAISIGATLAYLTDTDEDVNVMTLGKVKIDQLEYERVDDETQDEDAEVQVFHDNKPLLPAVTDEKFDYTPGDPYVDWEQIGKDGYTSKIWDPTKINNELDKMVFIKNKGDYDAYVRSVFAFEAGKYATLDQFKKMVHLNLNETDYTWQWSETPVTIGDSTYFVATATYNNILAPGALTEISLSQIALDSAATNEDVEAFGETYQILVKSQGIQAEGFDGPVAALNEGFGEVTNANIPFENDTPTKGTNLLTALTTYNGKSIAGNVQSIVFGKKDDYPEIIAQNKGILMDVEQDVPVYVYYVEEGGLYQIYLLAEDTIYLPANSSKVFNGMRKLSVLNMDNLSTERATTMRAMFQNCTSLKTLDATNWDTSKVTDMSGMFYNCTALTDVEGTENWDLSACTSLFATFYTCGSLQTLDTTGWDTSAVTSMQNMFQACSALTDIPGISGWDTGNVTVMNGMFYNCEKLTELDLGDWNTGNITNMQTVFYNCKNLKTLDVSGWDTSKATSVAGMFNHCEKVETLDVSSWNVSNVTSFHMTFQGCWALKTLDVSKWNTASATDMSWMFYGCGSLTELKMNDWDVSKVTVMSHMFADCVRLQTMPVDDWNVSSLQSLDATFNDCDSLTTINVSNWNTGNVREFSQSFEGCDSLVEIIGMENWNTSNGRTFDEMFRNCKSLKVLDLSSFNTANVTPGFKNVNGDRCKGFSQTFDGMNSVEKLVLGENFRFEGNGAVAAQYQPKFPAPAAIAGAASKWYNAANDTYYAPSEIPNQTAATYVAAMEPANS